MTQAPRTDTILTPAMREGVITIAQAAAAAILEVYDGEFAVAHKDDRSPLTAADLAAHHAIVDGLHVLTPDVPVLTAPMYSSICFGGVPWAWMIVGVEMSRAMGGILANHSSCEGS